VLPFTLALPYANLFGINVLTIVIGLILSSAFSAIVVFAQELVPGRVGLIAGIFFGLAFGFGGIGAAALGVLADHKGIDYVFWICSFLPLLGLLTIFLPNMSSPKTR
jgi:FSR family fosmidomycin resistance protein-like MFS transporter